MAPISTPKVSCRTVSTAVVTKDVNAVAGRMSTSTRSSGIASAKSLPKISLMSERRGDPYCRGRDARSAEAGEQCLDRASPESVAAVARHPGKQRQSDRVEQRLDGPHDPIARREQTE